ncbi:PRC-barrel domain-containing protein [Sphingomonas koreensis]
MIRLFTVLPLALAAACSDDPPKAPAGTEVTPNGAIAAPAPTVTAANLPSASGPGTAFGLTTKQIEDADLVDVTGKDLGDIHRVETDASGNIDAVIVEIDGTDPERFVWLPLTRLTAVADGDDWNLRAATSRAELIALPQVER